MEPPASDRHLARPDETLLLRYYGWSKREVLAERTRQDCAKLASFVATRPNLAWELVDLDAHPGLMHREMITDYPIRIFRAGRQVNCPELRDALRDTHHLGVESRPTSWDWDRHGFRGRRLPANWQDLEFADMATLIRERMRPVYHEIKDAADWIHGPFSDGWIAALVNLGAVGPRTPDRAVGTDEWMPHAKHKREPAPASFTPPDDATMRAASYRLLHACAVQCHVGHAAPARITEILWDTAFAKVAGFVPISCDIYEDPRLGLRVGYASCNTTHTSVYLYPILLEYPTDAALQEQARRQFSDFLQDAAQKEAQDLHQKVRPIQWKAEGASSGDIATERFAIVGFGRTETRPIGRCITQVDVLEWCALAVLDDHWLKVRFTCDAYFWVFEKPRFTLLLAEAWNEIAKMLGA
jgi:hypothetical protein